MQTNNVCLRTIDFAFCAHICARTSSFNMQRFQSNDTEIVCVEGCEWMWGEYNILFTLPNVHKGRTTPHHRNGGLESTTGNYRTLLFDFDRRSTFHFILIFIFIVIHLFCLHFLILAVCILLCFYNLQCQLVEGVCVKLYFPQRRLLWLDIVLKFGVNNCMPTLHIALGHTMWTLITYNFG